MTDMVTFDRNKLKQLKAAYTKAVQMNLDTFTFDHKVYVVGYAKYLIEYLEGKFNA